MEFHAHTNLLNPFTSTIAKTIQIYSNINSYSDFKYNNLTGRIITCVNTVNKCYEVYLDLKDYNFNITVMLNFISINSFTDIIKVYTDTYTDTLPVSNVSESPANSYRTKSAYPLTFACNLDNSHNHICYIKFIAINGTARLFGHYNSMNKANTVDYLIHLQNGNISVINMNSDLETQLTIEVVSYTDSVYELKISNLQNSSALEFLLTPNSLNSILSVEYQAD